MSIAGDRWTCPDCEVTERLDTLGASPDQLDRARRLAQAGHASRHEHERQRSTSIAGALAEAADQLAAFRIRLVVAPGDVERVRQLVRRRNVPIEVFAGDLAPGRGYVMQPRRGVRELSPSPAVDSAGDGDR